MLSGITLQEFMCAWSREIKRSMCLLFRLSACILLLSHGFTGWLKWEKKAYHNIFFLPQARNVLSFDVLSRKLIIIVTKEPSLGSVIKVCIVLH